jgi:Holliday junction DNA helicase RuvA
MIDHIIGNITIIKEQEVTIDAFGTMGFAIQVPLAQQFELNKQVKLHIHFHWSAENGPSLFGFANELDRSVFRIIIGCSGIGPKIGLAIVADLGAQSFLHAITTEDVGMLSKVSGIGKKKAEQIIVHLKHKVAGLVSTGTVTAGSVELTHLYDISQALESLNYSRVEIGRVMDYLKKNTKLDESSFDYLLRQALSYLSKQM